MQRNHGRCPPSLHRVHDRPALNIDQLRAFEQEGKTLSAVIAMLDEFSSSHVPPLTIGPNCFEGDEVENEEQSA